MNGSNQHSDYRSLSSRSVDTSPNEKPRNVMRRYHSADQSTSYGHRPASAANAPMKPSVTFFEMVNVPHRLTRSHSEDSHRMVKRNMPEVIAIIEDNTSPSCPEPQTCSDPYYQADGYRPSHLTVLSSNSSPSSGSAFEERDPEEYHNIDNLDPSLLPYFFGYTSAEREFIRQYQPVITLTQPDRSRLSEFDTPEHTCFWAM